MVRSAAPGETWLQDEWLRAQAQFRERIAAVNKLIQDHNLEIPNLRLERFILDAEREIERLIKTPAP